MTESPLYLTEMKMLRDTLKKYQKCDWSGCKSD